MVFDLIRAILRWQFSGLWYYQRPRIGTFSLSGKQVAWRFKMLVNCVSQNFKWCYIPALGFDTKLHEGQRKRQRNLRGRKTESGGCLLRTGCLR